MKKTALKTHEQRIDDALAHLEQTAQLHRQRWRAVVIPFPVAAKTWRAVQ